MTDERPGDADDDEGAAGPPDESVGGDPSARSDPSADRRTDGPPDADASDDTENLDDGSPDPVWTDDEPSERPDDAGPEAVASDSTDFGADDSDAAADGGSDATEFGGDINPHVDPSTGGPTEGAPAAPENVGAPDDEEMPLAEHIEEMVRRLGVVIVVMALVSGLAFPFADRMINFLWYSFLPGSPGVCPTTDPTADAACPYLFHPLALMFARLKVASLVGFIAALPLTVYESYLFMRPGLYPRERRYYLASVPTSLVLAFVGVLFAYLLVLPTLFAYFTGYTSQAAEVTFSLTETFNLIVMMLGFFALVFQIPLLIMLAVMMGVTSRRWLAARRIYFWGGFATIAFLFSPDPTGMAPILVAATMILLFEGTLLLLYWTGEATAVEAEDLAARRPFVWLTAAVAGYAVSTAPLPSGYYDQLPAAVTSALAEFGVTRMTPLLIGLALIALYETALYIARRAGRTGRAYRAFARARVAVWPLSLFVGYLGSPDPQLLQRIDAVDLTTVEAAGVVVGLIVAFEFVVAALDWYQSRE
ncbi:twin-arginine translocase subunit TatC [Halosimplex aquaticum]|uniref:Sec-independent protein translocase protein TatC n=1 Tax=Halosimplex aquaticum TaxID=3026162 RepID=A0ABD5Y5J6_9EURY|nr:twin-arginine translocase subunit TatC [Halosimplex aquaticum]